MRLTPILAVALVLSAVVTPHPAGAAGSLPGLSCAASTPRTTGSTSAIVSADAEFGFQLWNRLFQRDPQANLFIAPSSVALALQMAYDGARGSTAQAMASALRVRGMSPQAVRSGAAALLGSLAASDEQVQLDIANSVWARAGVGFRTQFLQDVRSDYGARAATLDFRSPQAAATINAWVSCATRGTIPRIVNRIPASAVMYLLNAVYFHGAWKAPFDPRRTHQAPFMAGDGQTVQVPMMSQTGSYPYYRAPDFQVLSLPYGAGRFSMVVILPRPGLSLGAFESRMTVSNWHAWTSHLRPFHLPIGLPRFSLRDSLKLTPTLKGMGMGPAFGRAADLSGMCSPAIRCRLTDVMHKTYLSVDEKGTTASGATSVGVGTTAMPQPMVVNHPFFLVIRDTLTGAILFMGAVNKPA